VSNNRLKFDGLEQLKLDLRRLPKEMRDDAQDIVLDSANEGAGDARSHYPRRTGNLADGIEVQQLTGSSAFAGAVVKNKAKLAFIFENGTQARHNDIGANRGTMPAGNVFVPAMIRARRKMYERLKAMMRSKGLKVTG
jgi:hypothetical protein